MMTFRVAGIIYTSTNSVQHLLFVFLMTAILTGVRWTLNDILICVSFVARDG
jgi:hypothetical protein